MKNQIPLPPKSYMQYVCGALEVGLEEAFINSGNLQVERLKEYGLYNSDTDLLDIGCGCGRFARHLIDSPIKRYIGFDRHPGMIKWATENITKFSKKIEFKHFDLSSPYDDVDGSIGSIDASKFSFPFNDNSFNVVNLASVFTHMPINEVGHYFKEMNRVLVNNGIALFTMFFTKKSPYNIGFNYYYNTIDLMNILNSTGWELSQDSMRILEDDNIKYDNCNQNWLIAYNKK